MPDRITARLRIEKAGRKGKMVTVIESLPRNRAFLKDLAGELKRACGSGGKAGDSHVEIQRPDRQLCLGHVQFATSKLLQQWLHIRKRYRGDEIVWLDSKHRAFNPVNHLLRRVAR